MNLTLKEKQEIHIPKKKKSPLAVPLPLKIMLKSGEVNRSGQVLRSRCDHPSAARRSPGPRSRPQAELHTAWPISALSRGVVSGSRCP